MSCDKESWSYCSTLTGLEDDIFDFMNHLIS